MMQIQFLRRFHDIKVYAVLTSILLSLWSIYVDNVINDDGTIYLRAAALIREGHWHAALEVHPWLFYSAVIAFVSYLTGLGVENAAHLVNATLAAVIVVCFIELVRELGGDKKTIIAAAVIILVYPGINEYRSDVIRDTGYLAFYVLSLLFFIRIIKRPRWQLVPGWLGGMLIAALFRIEGFVFLCAMPLIWQLSKSTDKRSSISLTAILVAMLTLATIAGIGVWLSGLQGVGGSIGETVLQWRAVWQQAAYSISEKLTVIREQVLPAYSADYAPAMLIATLIIILVHSIVDKLTPLFTVLTVHAVYKKLVFSVPQIKFVWAWLLVINIAILVPIVTVRTFITSRWPLALALTLLLSVPFSLVALYRSWQQRGGIAFSKNCVFPVVGVLFLLIAIDGLTSFSNKTHIKQAGIWLKENTAPEATLVSNSRALIFYSSKDTFAGIFDWAHIISAIKKEDRERYDYLALRVKPRHRNYETEVRELLRLEPIKTFENKKGDKVIIYRVPRE